MTMGSRMTMSQITQRRRIEMGKKDRMKEATSEELGLEKKESVLEPQSKQAPVIRIHPRAWMKMMYYTKHCAFEVGGLIIADGMNVLDVVLPEQEVSGASVDYNMKDLHKTLYAIVKQAPELLPKIKGTWHSHANLGASFSGTDEETAKEFARMGQYAISVVTDKEGKAIVKLHALVPIINLPVSIDGVGWSLDLGDKDLESQCMEDLKSKVTKKEYQYQESWNSFQGKRRKHLWTDETEDELEERIFQQYGAKGNWKLEDFY